MASLLVKQSLAVLISAAACSVWASPVTIQPKSLTSGIDQNYIDQKVKPKDDFYDHVNGIWLKQTQIPADKASWGAFAELYELSVNQLHGIIEKSLQQSSQNNKAEQQIANMYASYMDEKTIASKGIHVLDPEFAKIDAMNKPQDIANLMGHFSRIGVRSPFDMGIDQDMKDSDVMLAGLGQSSLGLPDRDYYLSQDPKFKQIRQKYLAHITRMLQLSGDQNAAQNAKQILNLETQLAQIQWTKVQNRDVAKRYNIYQINQLNKLASNFDWNQYLTAVGINTEQVKRIQVNQPSFFEQLNPILTKTPLSVWKTYFKWNLVSGFAPFLSQSFVDENFAFYSKTLRDVDQQEPRWKRGVKLVNGTLGDELGQLYVKQYFPADKKQRMDQLVQNLIRAYDQSIDDLDWMGPATKLEAKKKLSHLSVKIGYPNQWRDYSQLNIQANDLVGNVMRANEFEHIYELNKLGKPVDRNEWFMTPQTVNAYYNPSSNEIVFPAAILQPPFFNINADDAVNYGGIGSVIGHEISHAFDDQGSLFDEKGNMRNWWTEADHQRFKEKTQALVKQYSAYEPIKGYFVNGELTLGENIADNSGLAISYKAYQLSLANHTAPVINGYSGDQRFYMGWAQVWRSKTREAQTIVGLKTDPHSPDKVRANGALVNQAPFYKAFDIQQGDQMYLKPTQRVTIW